MHATLYDTPEHQTLRDQVARFIAKEVEPHAQAWEEKGQVPREVLQRMGRAGLLGLMYEGQYGGAEADAASSSLARRQPSAPAMSANKPKGSPRMNPKNAPTEVSPCHQLRQADEPIRQADTKRIPATTALTPIKAASTEGNCPYKT